MPSELAMRRCAAVFITALAIVALSACQDAGRETGTTRVFVDSLNIMRIEHSEAAMENVASFSLGASPEVRIGTVSGPVTTTFAAISSGRRLSDGSFVVVDGQSRAVRLYDRTGGFVRDIGGIGQGPEEYLLPALVLEGSDGNLIVWDIGSRSLLGFRGDGSATGESLPSLLPPQSRDVAAVSFSPEEDILWVSASGFPPFESGRVRADATIMRLRVGADPDVLATFPGPEADLEVRGTPPQIAISIFPHWFLPQLLAAATPEGVWISDGTEWEVVRRAANDGQVDRVIRFRRPLERLDAARIAEIQTHELDRAGTPEARNALQDRHSRTEYPDLVPPIRDLFADELGRLWIGVLELPVADLPANMGRAVQHWIIVDSNGEEVVGRLSLPPQSRPLYADDEGVLLTTVDELDVPYVEWWLYQ